MTEELSQDSSRYQETSEGLDVNAGEQAVNSVEDTAVARGSQRKQAHTNKKKYDLGVLFVHGIGNQKSGKTFKQMFWPIKEEFKSSNKAGFREIYSRATNISQEVEILKGGLSRKALFSESLWNNNRVNQASGHATRRSNDVLGFIKVLLYLAYFTSILVRKKLRVVVALFVFFLWLAIVINPKQYSFSEGDKIELSSLFLILLFCIAVIGIFICFILNRIGGSWQYIVKPFESLKNLYQQIDAAVRYDSFNEGKEYCNRVKDDIERMNENCNKLLVVAHSMGGLLSYKALGEMGANSKGIHLLGVGSGLGPVFVLSPKKVLKMNWQSIPKGEKIREIFEIAGRWLIYIKVKHPWPSLLCRSFVSCFITLLFLLLLWGIAVGVLSLFIVGGVDKDFTVFPPVHISFMIFTLNFEIPFIGFFHLPAYLALLLQCAIVSVIVFVKYRTNGIGDVEWKEYSHFLDPVGNSATHVYPKEVKIYKLLLPGLRVPHVIPSYFMKFSNLLKGIEDEILEILYGTQSKVKSQKESRCMFYLENIISAFASFVLVSILFCWWFRGGNQEHFMSVYILYSLPSLSLFLLFIPPLNLHFLLWREYYKWDDDMLTGSKAYWIMCLLGVLCGCALSLVGVFLASGVLEGIA